MISLVKLYFFGGLNYTFRSSNILLLQYTFVAYNNLIFTQLFHLFFLFILNIFRIASAPLLKHRWVTKDKCIQEFVDHSLAPGLRQHCDLIDIGGLYRRQQNWSTICGRFYLLLLVNSGFWIPIFTCSLDSLYYALKVLIKPDSDNFGCRWLRRGRGDLSLLLRIAGYPEQPIMAVQATQRLDTARWTGESKLTIEGRKAQ